VTVNLALVSQGKTCGRCKQEKSLSDFNRNRTLRDGLQKWCRECHAPRVRRTQLQRDYGITPEDYDEMYEAQGGCCLGCTKHQSELAKTLHVDHNHDTGKVRGLLCYHCNLLAGHAKDQPRTLQRIAEYLTADGYTTGTLKLLRLRGYFNNPREEHSRAR